MCRLAGGRPQLCFCWRHSTLAGPDDPKRRAAAQSALAAPSTFENTDKPPPRTPEQLKKLLEISTSRRPASAAVEHMPVAVHFFLLPKEKQRLADRLRAIGRSREQALMKLVDGRA
ncbi:MAG: hypothetical protein R3C45_18750 [Phycisphaerales bacterium]